jgi:hypothetical protein
VALENAEQHTLAERYRNASVDTMVARGNVERLVRNGDESRVEAATEALAAIDTHVAWIRTTLNVKPIAPSKGYFYCPEPDYFAFQDAVNPR